MWTRALVRLRPSLSTSPGDMKRPDPIPSGSPSRFVEARSRRTTMRGLVDRSGEPGRARWLVAMVVALGMSGCFGLCGGETETEQEASKRRSAIQQGYVGSEACRSCHEAETKAWENSAHRGVYREGSAPGLERHGADDLSGRRCAGDAGGDPPPGDGWRPAAHRAGNDHRGGRTAGDLCGRRRDRRQSHGGVRHPPVGWRAPAPAAALPGLDSRLQRLSHRHLRHRGGRALHAPRLAIVRAGLESQVHRLPRDRRRHRLRVREPDLQHDLHRAGSRLRGVPRTGRGACRGGPGRAAERRDRQPGTVARPRSPGSLRPLPRHRLPLRDALGWEPAVATRRLLPRGVHPAAPGRHRRPVHDPGACRSHPGVRRHGVPGVGAVALLSRGGGDLHHLS